MKTRNTKGQPGVQEHPEKPMAKLTVRVELDSGAKEVILKLNHDPLFHRLKTVCQHKNTKALKVTHSCSNRQNVE